MVHTGKRDPAFKISGDWDKQATELKEKYPKLTDEDLKFHPGKENELLKKVESRLNKDREDVIEIIKHAQPQKA